MLDLYSGKNVFIRTVTHHYTGTLEGHDANFIRLGNAAWIADDGRFADALAKGALNEVEPYPGECLIGVGAILDISEWLHKLPRSQQ